VYTRLFRKKTAKRMAAGQKPLDLPGDPAGCHGSKSVSVEAISKQPILKLALLSRPKI
jgi:hypothetical protein